MSLRSAAGIVLMVFAAVSPGRAQTPAPRDVAGLLQESTRAYLAGDRDRAVALLEALVGRAQVERQPAIEASTRRRLAAAYLHRAEFERGIGELQRARALSAAIGDPIAAARAVLEMGQIQRAAGRTDAAIASARSASAAFKALGDLPGIVDAAELLVYALPDGKEHTTVRHEAMAITDGDGHPRACGVLHEWGDELFTQGRAAEAFTRLSEARACFARAGERDREGRSLVSLGRVYRLHGRLDDALAQYRIALALHDAPGSSDPTGAVQAMNAIAVTLSGMGRYDEAGAQYEAALARARRTAPATVPFFVANLGGFHLEQGRYAQALALLDEAIASSANATFLARRLAQRGSALAGLGRTEEAMIEFNRAVSMAQDRGPEDAVPVRRSRVRFLIDAGRFVEAEADLRALTETFEATRAHNVPSDVMRRGFNEVRQDVFGAYVDLLARQGKAGAALVIAEQARARAFLDLRAERAG